MTKVRDTTWSEYSGGATSEKSIILEQRVYRRTQVDVDEAAGPRGTTVTLGVHLGAAATRTIEFIRPTEQSKNELKRTSRGGEKNEEKKQSRTREFSRPETRVERTC